MLEKNGKEIDFKVLETDVQPLGQKVYTMPIRLPADDRSEYAITVSFRLKEDTLWGQRGHEVAFGQHVKKADIPEAVCDRPVSVISNASNIGVKGMHFSAIFSREYGFVSYKYAGQEMIEKIPAPNFWRAPVDNDRGNKMPARYGEWKLASLYQTITPPALETAKNFATITYNYALHTTPAADCQVSYTVFGDGTVKVDMSYNPGSRASAKDLLPMPEFGMLFKLNADYENLEWYGMGPEETYVDKVTGAKLGIYRNKVKDNMAEYLVPQECGNKVGVRYAKLTNAYGKGIIFTGDAMEFSALPYTPHELENAMHHYELPVPHYTVVRVNMKQMGIAGDNSWGALTHDEYLLPANEPLNFSFRFKGI